jgi:hypothetical protein
MRNRISNNQLINLDIVGLEFTDSFRNIIFQNNFAGAQDGLDLTGSLTSLNNVTRNLFRSMSLTGVFLLDRPSLNIFVENTFMLNHIGVNLQNSTGNMYYHNSFLRNGFRHVNHVFPGDGSTDVWDNRSLGGPRGGNYWDNYTGTDADKDGIGDTNLPADGLDNYPLMAPFAPVPLAVAGVVPSKMSGAAPFTVNFTADVLGTLKPFIYSWSFGDNGPTSDLVAPTHTYNAVGNYIVSLSVKDTSGSTSFGSVNVSVVPAPASQTTTYVAAGALALGATVLGFIYYRRRHRRRKNASPVGTAAETRAKGSRRRG